jgi:hypothetical protein
MMASNDWTVRKVASELRPGDRFVFSDDLGGEGEVVTVEAAANLLGTVEVQTEELDFDLDLGERQMVTMAPPEGAVSDGIPEAWIADTVTFLMDEAVGRFHNAGVAHHLTPAEMRVKIATAQGLPQYLQTMLAARYSEKYETEEKS